MLWPYLSSRQMSFVYLGVLYCFSPVLFSISSNKTINIEVHHMSNLWSTGLNLYKPRFCTIHTYDTPFPLSPFIFLRPSCCRWNSIPSKPTNRVIVRALSFPCPVPSNISFRFVSFGSSMRSLEELDGTNRCARWVIRVNSWDRSILLCQGTWII